MLKRLVVVVHPSLYRYSAVLVGLLWSLAIHAASVTQVNQEDIAQGYLAKIELHTEQELVEVLDKAYQLSREAKVEAPVAFILHGSEAEVFLQQSYLRHKHIVDLANDLIEREVITIQICRSWMFLNGFSPADFVPAVGTVRYAPSEIDRLLTQENYTYF